MALSAWWSQQDAIRLNDALSEHLVRVAAPTWKREAELRFERIQTLIQDGEDRVRAMPHRLSARPARGRHRCRAMRADSLRPMSSTN